MEKAMSMDVREDEANLATASLSFRTPSSSAGETNDFFMSGVDGDYYHGSPIQISAASPRDQKPTYDEDKEDGSDHGFEFTFVIDGPESSPPITADNMFSDGRIRPIYPVFDRSLLLDEKDEPTVVLKQLQALLIEEREGANRNSVTASSSGSGSESSEVDELEGIAPGTYCKWTPGASSAAASPARCKKSRSTGSLLRWRLRDLVSRSHSDGKEKFVFLAAPAPEKKATEKPIAKAQKKEVKNVKKPVENVGKMDVVTAHRIFYSKAGQSATAAGRRTFLPYRQDLIGLFANGFSRTYHPL